MSVMLTVGIDVAKYKADIHYKGKNYTVENKAKELTRFFKTIPSGSRVALAGLAPRNNESETYQGKRYVRGGRVGINRSLIGPLPHLSLIFSFQVE